MFNKSVIISVLTITSVLIFGTVKLCIISDKEITKYTNILRDYDKMSAESIAETATQTRLGVRKDLWFSQQDQSRLCYRIESDSSLLTIDSNNGKIDIKENLLNLKCWMQEKLSGSGASSAQQIRFL
jgi:hypothetical protein